MLLLNSVQSLTVLTFCAQWMVLAALLGVEIIANCPQNLVRAHKMLRLRAEMALENVSLFQYLMYKMYEKNQIWP